MASRTQFLTVPIASEHADEPLARGLILLRAAGLQPQSIARMIVDHGQRMTAAAADGEVALEIHLPELIGRTALKALTCAGMLLSSLLQLAVPAQNLRDRTRRRHLSSAAAMQNMCDLTPTPTIVAGLTNTQDSSLNLRSRARRAVMRPPRAVTQSRRTFQHIPRKPFISLRTAEPEATAQLAPVGTRHQCKPHKLFPLIHNRQLPDGHRDLSVQPKHSQTSVTHVSERCPPCPQSIHFVW
jgi:hypothetical protein